MEHGARDRLRLYLVHYLEKYGALHMYLKMKILLNYTIKANLSGEFKIVSRFSNCKRLDVFITARFALLWMKLRCSLCLFSREMAGLPVG